MGQQSLTVTDTANNAITGTVSLTVDCGILILLPSFGFNLTAGAPFSGQVTGFFSCLPNPTASQFSATVNWGDGTVSPGAITGPLNSRFTVTDSHTYAAAGVYTITVTGHRGSIAPVRAPGW
jgi:hypothetical protein